MSGYYGMTMGGTNRTVLCHRITVQTYRRTLPNGKVVTVQGYSRQGDPMKENARSAVNRNFNDAANRAIKSSSSQARWNMRDAGNSARAAANSKDWSQRQLHATNALTSASNAVGTMAKGYANAASTKAQQLAFNARNTWRDAKETMSAAWNTFKEEAKYAGSYVKACIDVGINWVKNLIGTVTREVKNLYTKNVPKKGNTERRTSPTPNVVRPHGATSGNYLARRDK